MFKLGINMLEKYTETAKFCQKIHEYLNEIDK